jgi:hypothetical protein
MNGEGQPSKINVCIVICIQEQSSVELQVSIVQAWIDEVNVKKLRVKLRPDRNVVDA